MFELLKNKGQPQRAAEAKAAEKYKLYAPAARISASSALNRPRFVALARSLMLGLARLQCDFRDLDATLTRIPFR